METAKVPTLSEIDKKIENCRRAIVGLEKIRKFAEKDNEDLRDLFQDEIDAREEKLCSLQFNVDNDEKSIRLYIQIKVVRDFLLSFLATLDNVGERVLSLEQQLEQLADERSKVAERLIKCPSIIK